jgi:hypothetical protein
LAYFAARGALSAMIDVAVHANAAFAIAGRRASTFGDWLVRLWQALDWFEPWSWIFLAACAFGVARGRLRRDADLVRRYARPLAWAFWAYIGVAVQMKLHVYQHAVFMIPCAILGATLFLDLLRLAKTPTLRGAATATFGVLVIASAVVNTPRDVWLLRAQNSLRFARGDLDAHTLTNSFDTPGWIDMTHAQAVGDYLRAHAAPNDQLLVRPYEAEIYYFSHLRYDGRFFWAQVLDSPWLVYRREEWRAEDRADILRLRPTWVVAWPNAANDDDLESAAWFESMGWVRQTQIGPFVILHAPL